MRRRKGRDVTGCVSPQRLSKQAVGGMLLLKQALPAPEQLANYILALLGHYGLSEEVFYSELFSIHNWLDKNRELRFLNYWSPVGFLGVIDDHRFFMIQEDVC